MEIKFETQLTVENCLVEVEKFVTILNQLASEKGVTDPIVTLINNRISFNEGDKLSEFHKQTSEKFNHYDITAHISEEEIDFVAYMVSNVGRYALLSYDLFDHIKTGGKSPTILLAAN